jgi:hypothetical protein
MHLLELFLQSPSNTSQVLLTIPEVVVFGYGFAELGADLLKLFAGGGQLESCLKFDDTHRYDLKRGLAPESFCFEAASPEALSILEGLTLDGQKI